MAESPQKKLLIVDRGQKNGKDYVIFERDGGYFGVIIDNEVHMHTSQEEVYRWLEENTQPSGYDGGCYAICVKAGNLIEGNRFQIKGKFRIPEATTLNGFSIE